MALSTTVVAALKFKGGVVVAADSQVSDPVVQVRWPMEKLDRVAAHPLVVGFSGAGGQGARARQALGDAGFRTTTFEKRDRVQTMIENTLHPIYDHISKISRPPPGADVYAVALTGLAAFMSADEPYILECELNGGTCFHEYFHALGSGGNTAYAVFRTLGGPKLAGIEEAKALMAMLRIMRTAIGVDFVGVSEPISVFVLNTSGVRRLTEDEVQAHLEAVDEWEAEERDRFFRSQV